MRIHLLQVEIILCTEQQHGHLSNTVSRSVVQGRVLHTAKQRSV